MFNCDTANEVCSLIAINIQSEGTLETSRASTMEPLYKGQVGTGPLYWEPLYKGQMGTGPLYWEPLYKGQVGTVVQRLSCFEGPLDYQRFHFIANILP